MISDEADEGHGAGAAPSLCSLAAAFCRWGQHVELKYTHRGVALLWQVLILYLCSVMLVQAHCPYGSTCLRPEMLWTHVEPGWQRDFT